MKINRDELTKTAGYVGLGLLIAGYVRYTIQEVMGPFNTVILILGAVLLIGSLVLNFARIRAYSGRRSTKLGANTTVMTVAVIALIGFANFLGYRHHKRFDLTTEKLYSLSDQTRKVVSGLQMDVKVIKFDKTDDQELGDRMHEYRSLSSHISYERIDPQAKPELAKQYNVQHFGDLVVASEKRTERPQDGGEQTLTDAIIKVTMDSVKTICFLEGHGEKSISSTEGDGYDMVNRLLKNENYETKKINLVSSNQVPSDCAVLVVAGPKQGLFPQEAAMIGKYLDSGGKVMVMLDPDVDSNLGDVLGAWNIQLGSDTVIDLSGVGRLFGTGPGVPLVTTYGSHAVTKDMEGSMTFFPLARSVSTSGSGAASGTEILKTSAQAWAVADLKADTQGDELVFNESRDKKGPISLGVAASKTAGDKEARLVVIGDSDFPTNTYARLQRNGDLFLNSVSWLAQDENLISIRPKSPT